MLDTHDSLCFFFTLQWDGTVGPRRASLYWVLQIDTNAKLNTTINAYIFLFYSCSFFFHYYLKLQLTIRI